MIAMRSEQSKYAALSYVEISIYSVSHCTNTLISSRLNPSILIGDYKHRPPSQYTHQSLPRTVTSCAVLNTNYHLPKLVISLRKKGMGVSREQILGYL